MEEEENLRRGGAHSKGSLCRMMDGKRQNSETGSLMTERSFGKCHTFYDFYFYLEDFFPAVSLSGGKGSCLVETDSLQPRGL